MSGARELGVPAMEPFKEESASAAVGMVMPGPVRTARIVMWVQAGAPWVLGILFGVIAAANRSTTQNRPRTPARGAMALGFLFLLVGIVLTILLLVYASKLKSLLPSARTGTTVLEIVLIVLALVQVARNPVGTLIGVALAGWVLYLLNTGDAKAAFAANSVPGGLAGRADIRDARRPGDFG